MKWKQKVKVRKEKGYVLCLDEAECRINPTQEYLVEAIGNGIQDDEELKVIIMKHEGVNEIVAGFTLAKFLLEYQEYVEEDISHYTITY